MYNKKRKIEKSSLENATNVLQTFVDSQTENEEKIYDKIYKSCIEKHKFPEDMAKKTAESFKEEFKTTKDSIKDIDKYPNYDNSKLYKELSDEYYNPRYGLFKARGFTTDETIMFYCIYHVIYNKNSEEAAKIADTLSEFIYHRVECNKANELAIFLNKDEKSRNEEIYNAVYKKWKSYEGIPDDFVKDVANAHLEEFNKFCFSKEEHKPEISLSEYLSYKYKGSLPYRIYLVKNKYRNLGKSELFINIYAIYRIIYKKSKQVCNILTTSFESEFMKFKNSDEAKEYAIKFFEENKKITHEKIDEFFRHNMISNNLKRKAIEACENEFYNQTQDPLINIDQYLSKKICNSIPYKIECEKQKLKSLGKEDTFTDVYAIYHVIFNCSEEDCNKLAEEFEKSFTIHCKDEDAYEKIDEHSTNELIVNILKPFKISKEMIEKTVEKIKIELNRINTNKIGDYLSKKAIDNKKTLLYKLFNKSNHKLTPDGENAFVIYNHIYGFSDHKSIKLAKIFEESLKKDDNVENADKHVKEYLNSPSNRVYFKIFDLYIKEYNKNSLDAEGIAKSYLNKFGDDIELLEKKSLNEIKKDIKEIKIEEVRKKIYNEFSNKENYIISKNMFTKIVDNLSKEFEENYDKLEKSDIVNPFKLSNLYNKITGLYNQMMYETEKPDLRFHDPVTSRTCAFAFAVYHLFYNKTIGIANKMAKFYDQKINEGNTPDEADALANEYESQAKNSIFNKAYDHFIREFNASMEMAIEAAKLCENEFDEVKDKVSPETYLSFPSIIIGNKNSLPRQAYIVRNKYSSHGEMYSKIYAMYRIFYKKERYYSDKFTKEYIEKLEK